MTIAPSARVVARGRTAAPAIRREPAKRAPLRVVSSKPSRDLLERRRVRTLVALTVLIVIGTLLLIAACQAVVASQQVGIDNVQQELSSSITTNQNLQLERAQVEAPANILHLAQHDLGLVAPKSVLYLAPVDPGPSVGSPSGTSR